MDEKRRRAAGQHLPLAEPTGTPGAVVARPFAASPPNHGRDRKSAAVRVGDTGAVLAEAYYESAVRVLTECSDVADRAIESARGLLDALRAPL
jgi:hypothetical protein